MVGRGGAALVELLLESRHLLGLLLDVRPVLFDLCKSNQLYLAVKAISFRATFMAGLEKGSYIGFARAEPRLEPARALTELWL